MEEILDRNIEEEIRLMMDKTNTVLVSKGVKEIDSNDEFMKSELNCEYYAAYTIQKQNCIELRLGFSSDGVNIGINEYSEVFSFSFEEIESHSELYVETMSNLFFCPIIIKNCRFGLNFFYVRQPNGQQKLIRKLYIGVMSLVFPFLSIHPTGCITTECKPLYSF